MNLHFITVHPFDPWGSKIGGIETFIRAMFRCTPAGIRHSLIGVSEDTVARPLHQWQTIEYEGNSIRFYPVILDTNPNKRSWVPLFLRFSWRLRNISLPDDMHVLLFHRIEPIVMTQTSDTGSHLFIHGNPEEITGPHSEVKWKHIPWLYRLAEKKAVKKSNCIHIVSQSGLRYLQNHYTNPTNRFCFQPTGFDERVFTIQSVKIETVQKYNLNPLVKYVLWAGRLEAQKNPLLALESFFQLRKTHKAHFLIAGEGSQKEQMKAYCSESQFGKDVHFLGGLNSRSLAELMNCCHLFLMTSHFEGMPVAALEALACGLPVVSTDVGEICLFLQDGINGKVVHQTNPVSIANALSFILNNPDLFHRSKCSESVQAFQFTSVMKQLYNQLQSCIEIT